MSGVMIYQREGRDFDLDLSARGHHVVYRANESNRCPGCGRAQWFVGRITAECGFCGTAVPLADAKWSGGGQGDIVAEVKPPKPVDHEAHAKRAVEGDNRRRHERVAAEDRTLQLLIDGSPHSFAVHNLSAAGMMGSDPVGLKPMSHVQVRFEGGILVPAQVRWTDGPLTGLTFSAPVLIDLSRVD